MNVYPFGPPGVPAPAPAAADGFFAGSGHVRILRHLEQAIAQDDRLVVLTGDDGVGKSTVVQRLLHGLDRSAVWCVQLAATQLDTGELRARWRGPSVPPAVTARRPRCMPGCCSIWRRTPTAAARWR